MGTKPNFVIIMPDQHRADIMGCAGHPIVKTPNLDRLASEGVRFKNTITQSPLCVPARAVHLLGRYVHELGTYSNRTFIHERCPELIQDSFLNILKHNGYETIDIGKQHFVRHLSKGRTAKLELGSLDDHAKNHEAGMKEIGFTEIQEVCGKMESRRVGSYYTDALEEHDLLKAYQEHLTKYPILLAEPIPLPSEYYIDNFVGDLAIKWLKNYNNIQDSNKPFCLFIGIPGPHDPFDCIKEYVDLYNPEEVNLNGEEIQGPKRPFPYYISVSRNISRSKNLTEDYIKKSRAAYYANVTLIDQKIGEIRKILEEKGLLDNTWIIYTSDHGEMLGDHKLFMKFVFYRSAVMIPLIVRPPEGIKGKVFEQDVELLDIPATIFEILNINPPPNHRGKSLLPFIYDDTLDKNYHHKELCISQVGKFIMGATTKWKFVFNITSGRLLELYDRTNDYYENNNLAHSSEGKVIGEELYNKYFKEITPRGQIGEEIF
ncbi:MAG: sulfatase [Candidatus Hodarchaeota archaeon]